MTAPSRRTTPKRATATNGHAEAFDLDALKREETHEPFRFTQGGRTFEAVHPTDLDWHVQAVMETNDLSQMVPHMFAHEEDWHAFDKIPLPMWKLDKLIEAWFAHAGIDVGELEASSGSSDTTVQPSRPTSERITVSGSRTSPPDG